MRSDDEKWFDALAGHDAPASADEGRMQRAVRKAAAQIEPAQSEADMLAERRLLQRLEREGLLASSRKPRWRPLRLAQAAVIVLCVGLAVELVRVEPLGDFVPAAEAPMPEADMPDALTQPAPPAQKRQQAESRAQAMAQAQASHKLTEAAPSKPLDARAPATSRDQAVGAAVPSELRHSAARAAPPADILVAVAERAQAWRELHDVIARNTGLTVISQDESAYRISLRCAGDSSCDSLREWLHDIDQRLPPPQIGQVMRLRLEPRS